MTTALALTFHGILSPSFPSNIARDTFIKRYIITSERFEQTTELIQPDLSCTISELIRKREGHWLVLTFDDGLISDFDIAFPALLRHGLKATFLINSDNVGQEGYCNRAQLKTMAEAGMEIGSHGVTHRYLTTMSRIEAIRELYESKERLENEIEVEVTSFAPVGGHYRNWMCEVAHEAGYRAFATMIPGKTQVGNEPALLRRNQIQAHHDANHIYRLLKGDCETMALNSLRYYSLRIPKALLGIRTYDRIKGFLMQTFLPTSFSSKSFEDR